jgi:hypothetical protein
MRSFFAAFIILFGSLIIPLLLAAQEKTGVATRDKATSMLHRTARAASVCPKRLGW